MRDLKKNTVDYVYNIFKLLKSTFPRWPAHATFPQSSTPAIFRMMFLKGITLSSVSDPYHFDSDPDPRIRIRDDGSGS